MLTRTLRVLQGLLAVELAVTLIVAHGAVLAAASLPRSTTPLSAVSPYSAIAAHPLPGFTAAIALLLAAALGKAPRVLAPVQFWLTAWFPVSCVTIADGGDLIAGLLLFEMLPFFVRPSAATAALSRTAVRVQMAFIYLSAGITKLEVPAWRSGAALHSYAHDPLEGLVSGTALRIADVPLLIHLLTWATPFIELAIAGALFGTFRYRRVALVAGVGLHAGIAVGFGLYTFQAVMICGLVLLTEPWRRDRERPAAPSGLEPAHLALEELR